MNRLLSFTGQQPIYLGDFDFLQNATKSMLTCLARALMDQGSDTLNAIIQGANIMYSVEGSDILITPGVVVINGEIFPFAGGTVTGNSSTPLYFHVVEDTSGERVFKDGVTHKCWATRYAIVNTTSTDGVNARTIQRLHDTEVSDDVVYNGASQSANIATGKLIRKNGFWFIDVVFNISEGSYSNLGSVLFSGIRAEHIEELAQRTFPFIMAINTSYYNSDSGEWGPYEWVAQPVQASFTSETSTGVFSLVIQPYNNSAHFNGVAKLTELLCIY